MSAKKTRINIASVSRLANLTLSPSEELTYQDQLAKILDYVQKLESIDTKNVEPTFNISTNNNVTRDDIVNNGLTQNEGLQNTPNKIDGYIVTKGVFNNE